jgi:hypothetical protein
MHQSHAKTSQDKSGSSLGGKKDGFRVLDPLDKILGRFTGDSCYQSPVLFQNDFNHFRQVKGVILCRIVFR